MKILFNTHYISSPATVFYKEGFEDGLDFDFNQWGCEGDYSVLLTMGFQDDLEYIKRISKLHSKLLVGIIDARDSQVKKYSQYFDFMIIDSIEVSDFFSDLNKPMCLYYEYPNIGTFLPIKKNKTNKLIIGYHGNRQHLLGCFKEITPAIAKLAETYQIEFRCIYNLKQFGELTFCLPNNVQIKHIQWQDDIYEKELRDCDIGIVPALLPIKNHVKILTQSSISKYFFRETKEDYLLKFKVPSNPGRLIVFAKLGVPVVADMFPSSMQMIQHGVSGFLCVSKGGWYNSLNQLASNKDLCYSMATNLADTVEKKCLYKNQNKKLIKFLTSVQLNRSDVLDFSKYKIRDRVLKLRLFKYYLSLIKKKATN